MRPTYVVVARSIAVYRLPMRNTNTLITAVLLPWLLATGPCEPDPSPSPTRLDHNDGDDRDDGVDPGRRCSVSADCRGGEVCEDERCVRVCSTNDDCDDPAQPLCGETGRCLACLVDDDCDDDRRCEQGQCAEPACRDDVDCDGGFICDGGVCAPIEPCEEGTRCFDERTVATCSDGQLELRVCPLDERCVEALGVCQPEENPAVCTEPRCLDDDTAVLCVLGVPVENDCDVDEVCRDGACEPFTCEPQCGVRECGPDPLCGQSCGSCANECTVDGRCVVVEPGVTARVTVRVTGVGDDGASLFVARGASGDLCNVDTCFFGTCDASNGIRPEWDGVPGPSSGDPVLSSTNTTREITFVAAGPSQTWRVGAHNGANPQSLTINVIVDGVTRFGRTRTVGREQMWEGITIRFDGESVSFPAVVDQFSDGFSCGGEVCTADIDCTTPFSCEPVSTSTFAPVSVCLECGSSTECGAQQECREGRCIEDPADRGRDQACVRDVECRDVLSCVDGRCAEPCSYLLCLITSDGCCEATGGECQFNDVCSAPPGP